MTDLSLRSILSQDKVGNTSGFSQVMKSGKVPPHSREIEQIVLGTMMVTEGAFEILLEAHIGADCFYVLAHKSIYEAAIALNQNSKNIDIFMLTEQLRKDGKLNEVGGEYYLTTLSNGILSAAHLKDHAYLILEKFIQRELIRIGNDMVEQSYKDSVNVFELLDKSEQGLFSITEQYLKRNVESISDILATAIAKIDEMKTKATISGVTTGYRDLDHVTYGWQPGNLIIVAARPAMGKTAFALNLVTNSALLDKRVPVAFFTLEMGATEVVQRMLSSVSEVALEKVNRGKLEDWEYQQLNLKGVKILEQAPIFIDETPALNAFELRAKARRLVKEHKVGMIVIDYLQLMTGVSENRHTNREQEVSNISRSLKALAKELNIPIIALSQLNRSVESRGGSGANMATGGGSPKMPQLSDLRESGAIEQDADLVLFINRPEYYNILQDENGESTKGIAHVGIAKHRNGTLETFAFKFESHIQRFRELGPLRKNGPMIPYAGDILTQSSIPSKHNDTDVDDTKDIF